MTLLGVGYGRLHNAAAQDNSAWLMQAAPSLSKVVELPANTLLPSNNVDCQTMSYLPSGQTALQQLCGFGSPLGTLTVTGNIQTGQNKFMPLYGPDYQSVFLPTPTDNLAVLSITSSGIGNEVGVYYHLTKAALKLQLSADAGTYYYVTTQPDALLRDYATRQPLQVNTQSMAFSGNGEWMVVDMPHRGLLRVNMNDLSTQLFAAPIEPPSYIGLANPPLAVSDDGRYVAANTDIFGTGNITVYDLSTCTDQLDVPTGQQQYCAGKDVWHGLDETSQPMGSGLLSEESDLQRPTHLRFVNDDTVSFDARYAVVSGTEYKAAEFVATAPGEAEHKLGLLGLGDSYISGQGTYQYREETDTANNSCHLSLLSYPFILGSEYFDSYNSIACSGALTRNVVEKVDTKENFDIYTGQVADGAQEKDRIAQKPDIFENFLPGYIYQQEFASKYTPEAMLLSVGGDDIGFGNIVRACVAPSSQDTCYSTYEDRAELVNQINNTYGKLVTTYQMLRQQSGSARLYVVGYPQIAQPGGDCGLNVHLGSQEVEFSSHLISYLDGVVQRAAEAAGAFYVDTQQAFDGHKLCEAGDKAMNGFTVGNDSGITIHGHAVNFIAGESYHPTPLGYRLLAQTIAQKTAYLTAPMPTPTAFAVPVFDSTIPLLQNMPSSGRPVHWVTNDDTMAGDVVLRGDAQALTVDGSQVQLQPGSGYQVVLHSDPVLLDEGGVGPDGTISTTVHIPADALPGYHALHVYGTDMAGQSVDIQKVIYVAASADDYDGDGVPNSTEACLVLPAGGQDVDQDSLDDACDPEIMSAPAKLATVSGVVSTDTSASGITDGEGKTAEASTENPASATVLGSSAAVTSAATRSKVATVTSTPPPQLPRLNWTVVAIWGTALTLGIAVASYLLRHG